MNSRYEQLAKVARAVPIDYFITTVVDYVKSRRLENKRLIRTLYNICVDIIMSLDFYVEHYNGKTTFNVGFFELEETTTKSVFSKDLSRKGRQIVLNAIYKNNVYLIIYNGFAGTELVSINGVRNPKVFSSGSGEYVRRAEMNFQGKLDQLFLVTARLAKM